jgi:hypothetical protein
LKIGKGFPYSCLVVGQNPAPTRARPNRFSLALSLVQPIKGPLASPANPTLTQSLVKAEPDKPNPNPTWCQCTQPEVTSSAAPSTTLPHACATRVCPCFINPSSAWICHSTRNRLEEVESRFIPNRHNLTPFVESQQTTESIFEIELGLAMVLCTTH